MWDVLDNLPCLKAKRMRLQSLRAVPDRELLVSGPIYIRGSFLNKKYLKLGFDLINRIFEGYWKLVKEFL